MDVTQLQKGAKTKDLKKSVVVFICNFDPFGARLARYDTYMTCEQTHAAIIDGRLAIYLSTKGDRSQVSPELARLLGAFSGEADVGSDESLIRGIIIGWNNFTTTRNGWSAS